MSECLHGHLVHKLEERTTYCYDCGRKVGDILTELQAENAELEAKLHEVREIYTGMEGFEPETAPEGYCLRILEMMYREALETDDE